VPHIVLTGMTGAATDFDSVRWNVRLERKQEFKDVSIRELKGHSHVLSYISFVHHILRPQIHHDQFPPHSSNSHHRRAIITSTISP
jgi:hypothetical protein